MKREKKKIYEPLEQDKKVDQTTNVRHSYFFFKFNTFYGIYITHKRKKNAANFQLLEVLLY